VALWTAVNFNVELHPDLRCLCFRYRDWTTDSSFR